MLGMSVHVMENHCKGGAELSVLIDRQRAEMCDRHWQKDFITVKVCYYLFSSARVINNLLVDKEAHGF